MNQNKIIKIIERKIEELSAGNKDYELVLKEAFFDDKNDELKSAIIKKKTKKKARVDEIERLKIEKERLEEDLNKQAEDLEAEITAKEEILRQYREISRKHEGCGGAREEAENQIAELTDQIRRLEVSSGDFKKSTEQLIEISSHKETEKRNIETKLEEEKQKVKNLEADKNQLLGENSGLRTKKNELELEKERLERDLQSYVDKEAEITRKIDISKNVAQVAQERESKIIEELVAAQNLLAEKESEIINCNEIIKDYDNQLNETIEENNLLKTELENLYKNNPAPKKKGATPQPSRAPSQLDNNLPDWQKGMTRADLVDKIYDWYDENEELKAEIERLTKKYEPQKEEKAPENKNSEQKPKSRPSSRPSSRSSSSRGHARTRSGTNSPRNSLIMTSMDNTNEVGVQAIFRKPSRNNSVSSLNNIVETPADYTDNQKTGGDYFTHSRSNNSSTDSAFTDASDGRDAKIESLDGIIRGLEEENAELKASLNVAEVNYKEKTRELARIKEEKEGIEKANNVNKELIKNLRNIRDKKGAEIEQMREAVVSTNKIKDLLRQSLTNWAKDIQNLENKKNEIQSIPNSKKDNLRRKAQEIRTEIENAKRENNAAEVISGLKEIGVIQSALRFINEISGEVVNELDDLLVDCQGNWEAKRSAIVAAAKLEIEEAPWKEEGENVEEEEELTAEDYEDEYFAQYKGVKDMIEEAKKARDKEEEAVKKIWEKHNQLATQEPAVFEEAEKSIKETEKLFDLTDFDQEQKIKDGLAEQLCSLQQLLAASQARVEEGEEEIQNLAQEIKSIRELFDKEEEILNDPAKNLTPREKRMIKHVNGFRQRSIEKRAAREQHITLRNEEEAREQEFIKEQIQKFAALQEEIRQLTAEKKVAKEALEQTNLGVNLEQVLQQKQELTEKLASLNNKLSDLTKKIFSPEELVAQQQEIEEQMNECQEAQNDYKRQLDELNKLTRDNNNNNNNNNNFADRYEKLRQTKQKIDDAVQEIEKQKTERLISDLSNLNDKYHATLAKNKKLEKELAAKQSENHGSAEEKEKELEEIREEKKSLKERVKRLESDLETANNDLRSAEIDTEEKGRVITENEEKIEVLQGENERLKQGILQVNEEKEDFQNQLEEAKKSIGELENRNGELRNRPTQNYFDLTVKELKEKNDSLKSSLKAAESRHKNERTRANNLAWGKKELEGLLARNKTRIDNLTNELNKSATTIQGVVQDRKLVVFEKAGLTSEINSLKAQITSIENRKKIRDWRNINQELTPELKKQWKRKGFSREETKEWIDIGLRPNDYEFVAWLRDIKQVNSDWVLDNGNDEVLRAEYNTYLAEKGYLTVDNLNNLRQTLAEKEVKLANDKKDYEALQREHRKAKSDLVDSEEARKRNEETINKLRIKIEEKEKALIDQVEKQGAEVELLKTLTSERDEWRGKCETAINSAQIKQKEDQIIQQELSEENAKLSTQITAQQAENEQLSKKIEGLEGRLTLIGGASKGLLEEHKKTKEDLEKTQAMNEFLTEQSRQKQTEIDSLKTEMEELEKLAADIQRAWQEKLDQKAEELEAVEFLLESEENSSKSQRDKVKELREELLASQAEQKKLQKEKEQVTAKLQKKVKQNQKEIARLTKKGEINLEKTRQKIQKIAELESEKNNLLQEKKNWKREQETNNFVLNKQKTQQELIEKELEETKEKLTKKLAQQSKFKKQQAELQGKLEEANNKLINSVSKVDELNRKLNEVKEAAENSLTDYQKTIASKNKDLAIKQVELENLKKTLTKEEQLAQENQTWLEDQLKQLRKEVVDELVSHNKTKQSLQNQSKDIEKLEKEKERAEKKTENLKTACNKKEEQITKKDLSSKKKQTNLKNSLNNVQATIRNARSHLQVKNLKNLPAMPQNVDGSSKSLRQLIDDFSQIQNQLQAEKQRTDNYENDICQEFNIANVNDWKSELTKLKKRPSHADYNNIKNERDNYKQELDTHTCSISCQQSCCLGDYERLQKKLTTQRKEIFWEINNSLELGLESKKLTLKKIITRIEELIRNPLANNQKLQKKLTKAKKTIELLKKQLAEKDPDYNAIQQAEYQKILKLVKNDTFQNCKKLGIVLTPSIQAKIKQASTLEMVMKERNKLLQNQFSKNQAELTQQKTQLTRAHHQERWIWISLLVISYLATIGWLSFNSKKQKRIE